MGLYARRASASGSPATAAWSAPHWCAASPSEGCEVLDCRPRATLDLTRQARGRALDGAAPSRRRCSSPPPRSAASSPTTRVPAEFLYDNLMIEANVIDAAYRNGVEKLLFLGSSCIYPKLAPQPIAEDALLTGPLEPTNEWYAIAKIAGIKLCQAYRRQYGCDFISAMPTNLYGPGDNYDLQLQPRPPGADSQGARGQAARRHSDGHLGHRHAAARVPARRRLRRRARAADEALFRRRARQRRLRARTSPSSSWRRRSARSSALTASIERDLSKPDGTPRKLMSGDKLRAMGWRPRIGLREGIAASYASFLQQNA